MESRMKVAVFNTQPPHLYFGGVERRIIENAKNLVNQVDTRVYSGTKRGFHKSVKINGTNFIPCFSTDVLFPLDNWVFNRSLSRMVDVIKADIYEAHTVSGYKFLKALKKRKSRKPFIQTIHGVLTDEYFQSSKSVSPSLKMKFSNFFMSHLGNIEREAAKDATLVVTVSQYSAKKIVQLYGIHKEKIRIVPNGVDIQRFMPIENCEKVKNLINNAGGSIILFVGNLIPRKGLHYLIDAAKNLVKEYKATKFVIVGDGPLKNNLMSYSKKQGVSDNFVFLGDISEAILPNLYSCADIFVSPSIQEGQGISLLEAQAAAKPVVAFNASAITEVVKNGITGLLVNIGCHELANAVSKLLSDSVLREKMGRSGRDFVSQNFSWDICSQKMFEVYSEVLEN